MGHMSISFSRTYGHVSEWDIYGHVFGMLLLLVNWGVLAVLFLALTLNF